MTTKLDSYWRPKWTCGRYNKMHKVAIMYNLIEGESFFFEGLSASVIGLLLSCSRGVLIDVESFMSIPKINQTEILDFFEELYSAGLLSKEAFNAEMEDDYRKRIVKRNREINLNNPLTLRYEDDLSDVENSYNQAIKKDCLCNAVIELTYDCSAQCIHCYNPGASRNKQEKNHRKINNELNLCEYKKLIDELYELGCYKVTLTGGDPFSKFIVWDIIQYLYDKDMAFDIFTNGIQLEQNIRKIVDYYPRSVSISLYSGLESDHEKITNIQGSFRKSISSIEQLSNYAVPLIIKCCIMRPNIKSYFLVGDIARQYMATVQYEISLQDSLDGDHCVSKHLLLSPSMLSVVLRDKEIPLYVGIEKDNYGAIKRSGDDKTCRAGETGLCITPNGNIQPCVAFPLVLGNIRDCTLKNILTNNMALKQWQETKLRDFKECGKKEYCQFCVICAGCNFVASGTPLEPCENSCYIAKSRYNVAQQLKKRNDPLKGKSVKDCLSEFNNYIPELKKEIY